MDWPESARAERRVIMFAAVHLTLGMLTTDSLLAARTLLDGAYAASYGDRLTIGRRAQLGKDMIYRSGLNIDSALTYGEYDLEFFAECVESALRGAAPSGLSFVDVGSGVGRLVLASALLWPENFGSCAGVEKVPELHELACDAERRVTLPPTSPPRRFICGDDGW